MRNALVSSTTNGFVLYWEVCLESSQKTTEIRGKFLQNLISSRDGPVKVQKMADMKKHKKTTLHLMCTFANVHVG